MQCGTCREAKSEQLPVSEVCRQCHEFSRWCRAVPKTDIYKVTLYLLENEYGERYVSTTNIWACRVLETKSMLVDFEVPE